MAIEDFHIAAGKLLQNASINELFLAKAFEALSGTSAEIAHAVFYSFDSLHGKASLLQRVAKITCNAKEKSQVDRLVDAAKKSNKQRNAVAHCLLVFDEPDTRTNMRRVNLKSPQYHSTSNEALAAMVVVSGEAINDGQSALEELCQGRGVSPLLDLSYLAP